MNGAKRSGNVPRKLPTRLASGKAWFRNETRSVSNEGKRTEDGKLR
jgi:hypothetical protein